MKVIAVTSGKGGVGKTGFSANLAISLSQFGHNVVLFDADLQLANVDIALGIQAEHTLSAVVKGDKTVKEILAPGPGGIKVAVGGSAVHQLMTAGPKRTAQFFEQIEDLRDVTDYLIYDTAAGLEPRVTRFLEHSDETILVTTPDPTAITDAYATAKVLFKRNPEALIKVVVNMVKSEEEAFAIYGHLNRICKTFLDKDLFYLGAVRHDSLMAQATRQRRPVLMLHPNACASQDIVECARSVWEANRVKPNRTFMSIAA